MRLLAFAASFRKGSFNKRLLTQAVAAARSQGAEVDHADFAEFEMPLYNGDVDAASGLPPGALELKRRIEAADGVLLASPEYNGSIPGTLKNAIDWVSRSSPIAFRGRPLLLMSTSPGAFGGVRGVWHTRIPLEVCGALVYPAMFTLPGAGGAFLEDGAFKDPANGDRLRLLMTEFLAFATKQRPQ